MTVKRSRWARCAVSVSLLVAVVLGSGCQKRMETTGQAVQTVSDELRADFELAPFYQKSVILGSFPVVGSAKVSDEALLEAAWIVRRVF